MGVLLSFCQTESSSTLPFPLVPFKAFPSTTTTRQKGLLFAFLRVKGSGESGREATHPITAYYFDR
jgi:hypothetical protein